MLRIRKLDIEVLETRSLLNATDLPFVDIAQGPEQKNSLAYSYTDIGNTKFFSADSVTGDRQLWQTNDTVQETFLVRDFFPGGTDSVKDLVNVNGTLFFSAKDATGRVALWKSDGTSSGTVQLKYVDTQSMLNYNGTLLFCGNDGTGFEVWRSDGTESGTFALRDINPGGSSTNSDLVTAGGIVYFSATSPSGRYLWRTDGTANGTQPVKQIRVGGLFGASSGLLYFSGNDGTTGYEIWKSDGTNGGTVLVKDLVSGAGSSSPNSFDESNGKVFFSANNGLWSTNGTDAGTTIIRNTPTPGFVAIRDNIFFSQIANGAYSVWGHNLTTSQTVLLQDAFPQSNTSVSLGPLIEFKNKLYFAGNKGQGHELWVSDGTPSGTKIFADLNRDASGSFVRYLHVVGGYLYFQTLELGGSDVWRTDGTAEGPELVAEIGGRGNANPTKPTLVNGVAFFASSDAETGTELFRSDQSSLGTKILQDINVGKRGSYPSDLTNVNGKLFFSATDSFYGRELWISDDTQQGTKRVADLKRGKSSSNPRYLTELNGKLYFVADGQKGGVELWKSDGTESGTEIVRDIWFGSGSASPRSLVNVNGTLYFTANDGLHGTEVWQSDGTNAGTRLVSDILPGSVGSYANNLTNANGKLYFVANDSLSGEELWFLNGGLPSLVRDIQPGPQGSSPSNLREVGGKLYFSANNSSNGRELWNTTLLSGTTNMVLDINPGTANSNPQDLINFGGTLFFTAQTASGAELWKSDGTAGGTVLVQDIGVGTKGSYPSSLTTVGDSLYFSASKADSGRELWKVGLSGNNPTLVRDIISGSTGSWPESLANFGGKLFFSANDNVVGREVWISDGTAQTTTNIANLKNGFASSEPRYLVNANGRLFFSANQELWTSDGTPSGTQFVKDLRLGDNRAFPKNLAVINDKVIFDAFADTNSDRYLFVSDGTAAGTQILVGYSGGSTISQIAVASGIGFVARNDGLTRTNGTLSGTFSLGSFLSVRNLVNVNGTMYFSALTPGIGWELWKSDGTGAGTVLVKDIQSGPNSSSPINLINHNGVLYFQANQELWRSDGTSAGTVIVKSSSPTGIAPSNLTSVGNTLYFAADNGVNGRELWRSDGTDAGTVLVQDINPGALGSELADLVNVNGELFFWANDGTNGKELWRSNQVSTNLVRDIWPGSFGSTPSEQFSQNGPSHLPKLVNFNGVLVFPAMDPVNGAELWRSDGTTSGTVMIHDYSERDGSFPSVPLVFGNDLIFTARSFEYGRELYRLPALQPITPSLSMTASRFQFREDAGADAALVTIHRDGDISGPLTVNLANSSAAVISTLATVTFAPYVHTLTIPVNAVDDDLLDGLQQATLTASASGYAPAQLSFDVFDAEKLSMVANKSQLKENDGSQAIQLTITRSNSNRELPLSVSISSNDPSEAAVSTTVTIPANQTSVTTWIAAVDDTILDGTETFVIAATSLGYDSDFESFQSLDSENLALTVSPSSFLENAGANAANLTIKRLNSDITKPVVIQLTNGDPSEISIPTSVTIPANVASVDVAITAVDDLLEDGSQNVSIGVTSSGYEADSVSVQVLDIEPLAITLSRVSFREDAGANAATLTIRRPASAVSQNLAVEITSTDVSELTAPLVATIPAGLEFVEVAINAVDDQVLDGTQNVTLKVTAPGYDVASTAVSVLDAESIQVSFNTASISEASGSNAATLTITRSNTDTTAALDVALSNLDSSELSIPTSFTIPAGQSSAVLPVSAVDDDLLDGTQTVRVNASSIGYDAGSANLDITDFETLSMTPTILQFKENAGPQASSIRLRRSNTDVNLPVSVSIANSIPTKLSAPAIVTIPSGQQEVSFFVGALDNSILDGTKVVSLDATANNYQPGNALLSVLDFELLSMTLDRSSFSENAATPAATLTVKRFNTDRAQPITVVLSNPDPSELSLPPTLVIPANQESASVLVTAVDDNLLDGPQDIVLRGNSNGYEEAAAGVRVLDAEKLSVTASQSQVREDAGNQAVRVTVSRSNTNIQQPLTFGLVGSSPSSMFVPAQATIPANQSSVDIWLDVLDDSILDGTQVVQITAAHSSYSSGMVEISVIDVESLGITTSSFTVLENAGIGAAMLTVRRNNTDLSSPINVNLSTNDTSEVAVPATVTIPAGEAEVEIPFDAIDDQLLDGLQWVEIVASAVGYQNSQLTIGVDDIETLSLSSNLATVAENAGAAALQLKIRRNNLDLDNPITVALTSSSADLLVPPTVTIPAGQKETTVSVDVVDDNLLDGTQITNIIASSSGYLDTSTSITIVDAETITLTSNTTAISEAQGKVVLTVSRSNTNIQDPLEVLLSSNDTTEASVPNRITIPGGAQSITTEISGVDDNLLDGTRSVEVMATAVGYSNGQLRIDVQDDESIQLTLDRTSIPENSGNSAAKLTVSRSNTDIALPLIVQLENGDSTELGLPSTVTIPAGKSSAMVNLNAIDDDLLDGDVPVQIRASAAGYVQGTITMTIQDAEKLRLEWAFTATLENAGLIRGGLTVSRSNTDIANPLVVSLFSEDSSELSLPTSITIPAAANSVTVDVTAMDDNLLDGTQTVFATASALGYAGDRSSVLVRDFERLLISTDVTRIREDAGASAAKVTIQRTNTDTAGELSITLTSSDRSELTLPTTIKIPAGQQSVEAVLNSIDDSILDGDQNVTLTASAIGYANAEASVLVQDAEAIVLTANRASIKENSGANAAMLTIRRTNTDRANPIVVNLSSNNAAELILPSSVEIPANAASVQVPIDAIDDTVLDGLKNVQIMAQASGYDNGTIAISVTDQENITLALANSSVPENGGQSATFLTVRRSNTDNSQPIEVSLSSSLSSVIVPPSVTIASGNTEAIVSINVVDDTVLTGLRTATIVASATGYENGSATLQVLDVETLSLDLNGTELSEAGGRLQATVRRSNTNLSSALTVTVSASTDARLRIPATVTIPVGSQTTNFFIDAVDDRMLQGEKSIQLQAKASGFSDATTSLKILDSESLSLQLDKTSIPEKSGATTLLVSRSDVDSASAIQVAIEITPPGRATLPTLLTIPAGQRSVEVAIQSIDNLLFDGDQNMVIRATSSGFANVETGITIIDEETRKPGTNPRNPLDVNADRLISPLDAVLIINLLNRAAPPVPLTESGRYFDTSADLIVSPLDALRVINYLNLHGVTEAEGELLVDIHEVDGFKKRSKTTRSLQ